MVSVARYPVAGTPSLSPSLYIQSFSEPRIPAAGNACVVLQVPGFRGIRGGLQSLITQASGMQPSQFHVEVEFYLSNRSGCHVADSLQGFPA